MEKLKIGTFNIKNNIFNRDLILSLNGLDNSNHVANLIRRNEIDVLGTQELTFRFVSELGFLLPDYSIVGDYRYGNRFKAMTHNEGNQIITNKNVIGSNTLSIPWIPKSFSDFHSTITSLSLMPRIATIAIIKAEDKDICVINTHLDFAVLNIQTAQLKFLKGLIEKYSRDYDVILTGDFNMEVSDKQFDSFIAEVKDKVTRIDIGGNTFH